MTAPFVATDEVPATPLGDPRAATLWQGCSAYAPANARGMRPAHYRLTPQYLYLDDGRRSSSPRVRVERIRDVFVHQDDVQRHRGIGDLEIADGTSSTWLHGVRRPLAVRELVLGAVRRSQSSTARATDAAGFLESIRPAPDANEILVLLQRIGTMRDAGLMTEEQFQVKRAELLARL